MLSKKDFVLNIGNLTIQPPIIQGGMGVRVSRSGLAAAVANEGCVGVIASVGLGDYENVPASQFVEVNNIALRNEIRKAREMTKGIIGVNVMVVLSNYEELIRVCVEENVDMIISGAGLPLSLPALTKGTDIKLVPIVSSVRAFSVIYKNWKHKYDKVPDAVIVEGPLAGGHLGYAYQDLINDTAPTLEVLITELTTEIKSLPENIPVIAAGGIFDGADIMRFLRLGASGVQMATRFVCTDECDADENFKKMYLSATKDDIRLIKSPVGLPGRVIGNEFTSRVMKGETVPFICNHFCLRSCTPETAPYCIAGVLANASKGQFENAFAFAGANAYRCNEIVPVKDLIQKLKKEMEENI